MRTEKQQLRQIDEDARRAAAEHKQRAVALVAAVYDREGTQAKAGQVLGITKQRVGQLLKERAIEETTTYTRADQDGEETRTVRVARYGDGAMEVYVAGTTDGVETGPERIEFASTPPRHADAAEAEERLAAYLNDLHSEGYQ